MIWKKPSRRLALAPGLHADASRALWFESERVVAIADIHLGYAWAHRHAGHLLPLAAHDACATRVGALLDEYPTARELVLLGDIVHQAVPVEALRWELTHFFESVTDRVALRLILGNHDRRLPELLASWSIHIECQTDHRLATHTLIHGDTPPGRPAHSIVMGHEHPAIVLGDGVHTSAHCPCFLVSDSVLVLPAFTRWSAAAGDVRQRRFLSSLAREANFTCAVAIMGDRLLRVPL